MPKDLQYWRDRCERRIREILLVHSGKLGFDDLLTELTREGYNVSELAPLLPKFATLVIANGTVSLRGHQKRIPKPPPQAPTRTLTEAEEVPC